MQNLLGKVKEFKLDKKTKILLLGTGILFIIVISFLTIFIEKDKGDSSFSSPRKAEIKKVNLQEVGVTPALQQPAIAIQQPPVPESEKKEPSLEEKQPERESPVQGPLLY